MQNPVYVLTHDGSDFAELTGSGHILGSNSENSNLLPVAVE